MPTYSHSRLSAYQECPLKYKLQYLDRIERDVEGIEAFLGSRVHETLDKCYQDVRLTRLVLLADLLACYDNLWEREWRDPILITRQDMTPEHYRASGRRMIEDYYRRYAPFDQDKTVNTEMHLRFTLNGRYSLQGYVDRLSRTADDTFLVHDYKTGAHLPSQQEADNDRQLALYQIGIRQRWPDAGDIKLIWHYLAHDREMVSSRSDEALAAVTQEVVKLIEEIEAAREFPPRESALCRWCQYPDLCPMRKHFYTVEALPANEYLKEPGVVLVNTLAELRGKAAEIDEETRKVREAIIEYSRRNRVLLIRGSDRKARVRFDNKLKFPGKNDPGRQALDDAITEAGKWEDVSMLDAAALVHAVESGEWDTGLVDRIMQHGRFEETSAIYLSRLREEEE